MALSLLLLIFTISLVLAMVAFIHTLKDEPFTLFLIRLFFRVCYHIFVVISALIIYNHADVIFKGVTLPHPHNDDTEVIEVPVPTEENELVLNKTFTTQVTLTCYNPVASQCQGNPLVTASNDTIDLQKLKNGQLKWCAVSHNLRGRLPWGSVIEIEGHGRYIVKDAMNRRFSNRVDILQAVGEPQFKKTNVKITLISKPKKKEYYAKN